MEDQPNVILITLPQSLLNGIARRNATIELAQQDLSSYLEAILLTKEINPSNYVQVAFNEGKPVGMLVKVPEASKAENATVLADDTAPSGEAPDHSLGTPKRKNA